MVCLEAGNYLAQTQKRIMQKMRRIRIKGQLKPDKANSGKYIAQQKMLGKF